MDADFEWITEDIARALEDRLGLEWQEHFRHYARMTAGDSWAGADPEWKNSLASALVEELDGRRGAVDMFAWLEADSQTDMTDRFGHDWREVLAGYLNDTWGGDWTSLGDDTKRRMWHELLASAQAARAAEENPLPAADDVRAYLRGEADVPEDVERALVEAAESGTLVAQQV